MMPMTTKTVGMGLGLPPTDNTAARAASTGGAGGGGVDGNCEMRPGGMLVQVRGNSDQNLPPPPTIRVRVKYRSVYHEINISSQATFGNFHFSFFLYKFLDIVTRSFIYFLFNI